MRPEEAYVLVIEDDLDNLLVVTDLLRLSGVKHINAQESGWQGLELAESLPRVDLILLDIQLPFEDGYAILSHIRANPKLRDARVVAVTANVLPQDEARAKTEGFDGFIGKPLFFDRFPQQIQALLEGQQIWMAR